MKTVVVATQNAHKVLEIAAILDKPDWKLVPLSKHEQGATLEMPPENAETFEGNARIKARFVHETFGCATLADDSGLMVDALDGAPGIYSARYAGQGATAKECNAKLLAALEDVADDKRTARFVCSLVFIDEDGTESLAEGRLEGSIAFAPRGKQGFGYDPVFVPALEQEQAGGSGSSAGFGSPAGSGRTQRAQRKQRSKQRKERTLAEYSAKEKNKISHRANALFALRALFDKENKTASCEPAKTSSSAKAGANSKSGAPAKSSSSAKPRTASAKKVRIVAFDLDGTLLDTASPIRLVRKLASKRIMSVLALAKISFWGARYKLGLELDQSLPRKYIFGSFTNFPSADANAIMSTLYYDELQRHLRPQALERIQKHQQDGEHVILVSASFDPIVREVVKDIGLDGHIATQMEIKDGYYTGRTVCAPPEGKQKLIQLTECANEHFGEGNWEITWAYGDYFSDIPLLAAAQHAVAVEPDRRLAGYAHEHGWEIVDWPIPKIK